jgi:hypothetical protein
MQAAEQSSINVKCRINTKPAQLAAAKLPRTRKTPATTAKTFRLDEYEIPFTMQ